MATMYRIVVVALIAFAASWPEHARAQGRLPDVMALVRGGRWADADVAAGAYPDPVVRKLVTYYRLLSPGNAGLGELTAFLASSPDWPQQGILLRRRDEALAVEPDAAEAVQVCDHGHPVAAAALARCADAYQQLNRGADAIQMARQAWVAAMPDAVWDADFLRKWVAAIGPAEQSQRFDRLAWADPVTATRLLPSLAAVDLPRAEARLALRRDDPAAAGMVAALPVGERADPAIFLEQARWLRRASRDAEALALWRGGGVAAELAAGADRLPAFWNERNILARHRLRDGDAPGAYFLADDAVQVAPEQAAEAAFLAGWIALRKLGDPALAALRFARLTTESTAAISQARGHYWLARSAQAARDAPAASREFAAAAAWPDTFYGQLAALDLDADPRALSARIVARRDPGWNHDRALGFASRELARASAYLVGWGEPHRAQAFLLRLADVAGDPADLSLAAHLAAGFGMPETAVALARKAGRLGVVLLDAGWPVAVDVPATPGGAPDAALALGIIRQESSFDATTTSPVGARGLMQLMPGTAASEAHKLGVAASLAGLTASPGYNMRLGTDYLRGLLDRFGAAEPLATAAYNAGPARVTEWIATYGDPRGPGADMIDWIELIPFGETRNYVQRVVENTVIYRAKLNATQPHPVLRWSQAPA